MNPLLLSTAVALGIGLLIGIERERSKGAGPEREIAGIRSFALVALLGNFAALLDSTLALAALALLAGALAIAGYLRTGASNPGITTEIALIVAFVLGALSVPHPTYSAGAAVVVTVLLWSRPWLHEVVTARLSDRELQDGLMLAAAALVVLPLMPDRTVDPWDTLNPRKVWLVVVMVMAINAAGYAALRLWGTKKGLMLVGVLGGLVSSVTTHAALGQRAKAQPELLLSAAAGASFSSVMTAIFLLVVVAATAMPVGLSLAPSCLAAAAVAACYGWFLQRRAGEPGDEDLALGRPISVRAALIFAAVVSSVVLLSALLTKLFGEKAALASVAAAGFADSHAGAISAAMLEKKGVLSMRTAQIGVLLSFTTNAVTKIVISRISGPPGYSGRIAIGVVASVATAWLVWGLFAR